MRRVRRECPNPPHPSFQSTQHVVPHFCQKAKLVFSGGNRYAQREIGRVYKSSGLGHGSNRRKRATCHPVSTGGSDKQVNRNGKSKNSFQSGEYLIDRIKKNRHVNPPVLARNHDRIRTSEEAT